MKIKLLKPDEVADLIEQAELSGNIITQQQASNEVIYRIQDGAGEQVLINTPCGSYLIIHDELDALCTLPPVLSHQQNSIPKFC